MSEKLRQEMPEEEIAQEIEKNEEKGFDKREVMGKLDQYCESKKQAIAYKARDVAEMFPRRETPDGTDISEQLKIYDKNFRSILFDVTSLQRYLEEEEEGMVETDRKNYERIQGLPEFKHIEALARAYNKVEGMQKSGKEVLSKREENEMKKKQDKLLEAIEKL